MDLVKVCVGLSVFLTLGCCGATLGSKLYAALGDTEENVRDSTGSHVGPSGINILPTENVFLQFVRAR